MRCGQQRTDRRWRAWPLRDGLGSGYSGHGGPGARLPQEPSPQAGRQYRQPHLHLHRAAPRLPDGEGRDDGAGRGSVNRVNDWDSATRRFFLLSALSGLNGCLEALGRPTVCPATSLRRFCLPYPLTHQTGQNENSALRLALDIRTRLAPISLSDRTTRGLELLLTWNPSTICELLEGADPRADNMDSTLTRRILTAPLISTLAHDLSEKTCLPQPLLC